MRRRMLLQPISSHPHPGTPLTAVPLFFVPGLNCTGEVFAAQVASLSPRHACVIADHSTGITIEEIAANILAAAPPRFALIGFSLGGYIAFAMMRQAPERAERLALLDTLANPELDERRPDRLEAIALVERGGFVEAEQTQWPKVVHPSRYGDTSLRDIKMRMALRQGPELWRRHTSAIMDRADSRPTLATIKVPTLVLVGAEDQLTPPERSREMVAGLENGRLVVVPECGHMAPIERPDAVNAALADWLTW